MKNPLFIILALMFSIAFCKIVFTFDTLLGVARDCVEKQSFYFGEAKYSCKKTPEEKK